MVYMAFEPLLHFMRGIGGKLGSNVYGGLQGQSGQHMAFLRQIQKELVADNCLHNPLSELVVTIFDLETTGFHPDKGDEILSIGAVKVKGTELLAEQVFYSLVKYEKELSPQLKDLTGLCEAELKQAEPLAKVLLDFYRFARGTPLVAHHSIHEKGFLQTANWKLFKAPQKHRIIDTTFLSTVAESEVSITRLEEWCAYFNIPVLNRHHALGDAMLTAKLWCLLIDKVQEKGCTTLQDIYYVMAKR